MKFQSTVLAVAGFGALLANAANHFPYLNGTTIAQPTKGEVQYIYPRYVELLDGTILVTVSRREFAQPKNQKAAAAAAFFPVFSSADGGSSWDYIGNVTDQVNGWGLGAQPALVELTEPIGDYAEGTVLAAGNSWSDKGTHIDVYASTDKGATWKFVSNVAKGGPPDTTNGATPIWEPMLM